MSDRIELNELETYLYSSADILRGHVDASDYKSFIFPLLFFKRICDIYDEENEKLVEEYGEEGAAFMGATAHRFVIPDGHHWKDVRNTTENIGTAIVNAFYEVEQANEDKKTHEKILLGVFGSAPWANKNRLPDETLKNLIEHFSTKTLSLTNCPEDELGQAYEYLIKKFGDDSGHTSQEFYTNRTVVHLMTEMLKPQPGETVYDPTCGSAGMMISCIAYLKKNNLEWRSVKCYGQEINPLSASIGKMNLFLHGVSDFRIVNADTLKYPAFVENGKLMQFDICLANPPYSISEWGRDSFESDQYGRNFLGTPPQGRADYAFFQHILASLKPNSGRCAILFPHGVLTRNDEAQMRQKLVELDLVEAVIGIGKNLFFNSPMEACVVICRTQKEPDRKGKILFINAKNEITRKNSQSYLEDEHIERIANTYLEFKNEDGFSCVATQEEVAGNDYSLGIPRYVSGAEEIVYSREQIDEALGEWMTASSCMHEEYEKIKFLISEEV